MKINKCITVGLFLLLLIIFFIAIVRVHEPDSHPNISKMANQYASFSEKQVKDFITKNKVEEWPISDIEKLLYLNDNPHTYASDALTETLSNRIQNKLLTLKIDGKAYAPAAIFVCNRLKGPYELDYDDTRHMLEFPETFHVINWNKNTQFIVSRHEEYLKLPLCFYQGDLMEITINGYKNIQKLPFIDSKVMLKPQKGSREQIIFTIIKGNNEYYYKKIIWVIQSS